MLEITNLTKSFNRQPVLKKLSLEVKAGRFILVSGANGAGKTTLTRLLAGAILPDEGGVFWKGREVAAFSAARLEMSRESGVAFSDENSFYPHLTAGENIVFFENLYDKKRGEIFLKSAEMLEAENFMNKSFYSLSKGMKQKLCFLRALLGNPVLLVIDELDALDGKSLAAADDILKIFYAGGGAVLKFTSKKITPDRNYPDNAKLYTLCDGSLKELAVAPGQNNR